MIVGFCLFVWITSKTWGMKSRIVNCIFPFRPLKTQQWIEANSYICIARNFDGLLLDLLFRLNKKKKNKDTHCLPRNVTREKERNFSNSVKKHAHQSCFLLVVSSWLLFNSTYLNFLGLCIHSYPRALL